MWRGLWTFVVPDWSLVFGGGSVEAGAAQTEIIGGYTGGLFLYYVFIFVSVK